MFKVHVIANSCKNLTLFVSFILLICWYKFCSPSWWNSSKFSLLIISIQCYDFTIHLISDYFWHFGNQNSRKMGLGWNKTEAVRWLNKFWKNKNALTILIDIKDFLRFKMFCYAVLHRIFMENVWICRWFFSWPSQAVQVGMP